jgi:hypothetical protein
MEGGDCTALDREGWQGMMIRPLDAWVFARLMAANPDIARKVLKI